MSILKMRIVFHKNIIEFDSRKIVKKLFTIFFEPISTQKNWLKMQILKIWIVFL